MKGFLNNMSAFGARLVRTASAPTTRVGPQQSKQAGSFLLIFLDVEVLRFVGRYMHDKNCILLH